LWNAINLLKLTKLTADELVDGEIRGDEDYMHAIASASQFPTYDLIDDVRRGLVRGSDEAKAA
jgi:hypothetical protein